MRKIQEANVKNQVKVESNPKMFTVADGVQVAVTDLKGFKGDRADVKATVHIAAEQLAVTGHVGVFIDGYIHPLIARDFSLDAQGQKHLELPCSFKMESDKAHIQIRIAAIGTVNVHASIDVEEYTAAPEEHKPVVSPVKPVVAQAPPFARESFALPNQE